MYWPEQIKKGLLSAGSCQLIKDNTVLTWLQSYTENTYHMRNRPTREERSREKYRRCSTAFSVISQVFCWMCVFTLRWQQSVCVLAYVWAYCLILFYFFYFDLRRACVNSRIKWKDRKLRCETRGWLVKVKANVTTLTLTCYSLSTSSWLLPSSIQGHCVIITLLLLSSQACFLSFALALSLTHTQTLLWNSQLHLPVSTFSFLLV